MAKKALARPDLLAGEDLPPSPVQRRSLEKRARLKKAALALFAARGYENTTVGEIAQEATLAVGSFYRHFRSKRQVLLALMDDFLADIHGIDLRIEATDDIREALHGVLTRAFSTDRDHLGAYRAWREAVLSDPHLARRQDAIHAWTRARVTAVFERLQQLPGARRGVDVVGLAVAMDSFFWALLGQALDLSEADLDTRIESATHLIYHALFVD